MTTPWLRLRMLTFLTLYGVFAIAARAQTLTTLVDFNGTNGATPQIGSLVQGIDGNLYGVTFEGGVSTNCQALGVVNGCGTFFKMTADGTLTTLFNFCQQSGCTDGYLPIAITLARNGNFYGVTSAGGVNLRGTAFRITTSGVLTTLYSFCSLPNCADGISPEAALTQAIDGNWYGTTWEGGGNSGCYDGCGTVFRMTPGGQVTTLYAFSSTGNPSGALVQGRDGNLYGTSSAADGDFFRSIIFKVSPSGLFTTLYQFSNPTAVYDGLILGTDGNFYGTSAIGGTNSDQNCSEGCGTVFKMTPGGIVTTIYNFCNVTNCADGAEPIASLIQATDGKFYGTTQFGGSVGAGGTIFSISPSGTFSSILSFDTDGGWPYAGLLQHTNGLLYGTTSRGGLSNDGTIFSLNMGLQPFATFIRGFGRVGSTVQILGQGFTGATAVSFNDVAAAYTVKSDTFITATVPAGATSGLVTVTTPSGTLISNRQFRVNP